MFKHKSRVVLINSSTGNPIRKRYRYLIPVIYTIMHSDVFFCTRRENELMYTCVTATYSKSVIVIDVKKKLYYIVFGGLFCSEVYFDCSISEQSMQDNKILNFSLFLNIISSFSILEKKSSALYQAWKQNSCLLTK